MVGFHSISSSKFRNPVCQATTAIGIMYVKRRHTNITPAIIDTASNNETRKGQKGPLSDGPEGVKKMCKFYKNCGNVCWFCGYGVSKLHHNVNCRQKKKGHINSHTGDNLDTGASIKDKEFSKWA